MTEEYKELTLGYLVGNINETKSQSNMPPIEHTGSLNTTIRKILDEHEIEFTSKAGQFKVLYYENYVIVYNNYKPPKAGGDKKAYIIILDQYLNELAYIDKFSSGTDLYPIIAMNYDENGNFYAVTDNLNEASDTGTKRVILLNNIIASGYKNGNYRVILRASYFLKNQDVTIMDNEKAIYKLQNEATYYIASKLNGVTLITRFKNNVGAENEWTDITTGEELSSTGSLDCYAKKSGDSYNIVYGMVDMSNLIAAGAVVYSEYEISDKIESSSTVNVLVAPGVAISNSKVVIFDNLSRYVYVNTMQTSYLFYIIGSSVSTLIVDNYETGNFPANIDIMQASDLLLIYFSKDKKYSKVGLAYKNEITWGEDIINEQLDVMPVIFTNSYDLFTVYVDNSRTDNENTGYVLEYKTEIFQFVYNPALYNGVKFINTNSLVPAKMRLYAGKNDKLILFARGLYNKVIQNNSVTSTMEIPNTTLNNQQIGYEILQSTNNNILNEETNAFSKNIYETVNFNITDTWNIINENDIQSPVPNVVGASRLVNAMSDGTSSNYENAKIGYYRINYSDGTSEDKETPTVQELTNMKYRYTIEITPSKDVDTIQFLSADKNTIYQTSVLNLKAGKTYKVQQRVRIEGVEDYEINYNNQRVFYKEQRIKY